MEPAQIITLENENFHYLINVLRLRKGDKINIIFSSGSIFLSVLTDVAKKNCTVSLQEEVTRQTAGPEITLIQALPKGKKIDQIVRQAAECGVSTIVPVETEFGQVKIPREEQQTKTARWNKIIREAIQQSGSPVVTTVLRPCPLTEWTPPKDKDWVGLFFHQEILEINSIHSYLSTCPAKILICIGPEGGFSPSETDFLLQSGFHAIYLGKIILRSETAVVYALGAVKTVIQEIPSWVLKN